MRALLLGIGLAALLASGFISVSRDAFQWLAGVLSWRDGDAFRRELAERAAFPLLALGFLGSLPRWQRRLPSAGEWALFALEISILPVGVALCFGAVVRAPSIPELLASPAGRLDLFWYLLFVPVGEEALFRGWIYEILERIWPLMGSPTNPLPLAVWISALGFSLWHLQNLSVEPWGPVAFQVAYTLLTGLWLGVLRWRSGRVFPCILAHIAVNAATNVF
jgi:membrane protease YdiL (CAAX protease family)